MSAHVLSVLGYLCRECTYMTPDNLVESMMGCSCGACTYVAHEVLVAMALEKQEGKIAKCEKCDGDFVPSLANDFICDKCEKKAYADKNRKCSRCGGELVGSDYLSDECFECLEKTHGS